MSTKEQQGKAEFEQNFKKLEALANELQESKVSVDDLVPKMKEALRAFKVCRNVLGETKSQLKEISTEFDKLKESTSAAADGNKDEDVSL